jgi:Zn-dependent protease/CBS domain-containing protein
MFTTRWQMFRLLGIPISLDASWLVILALVTWTLGEQFAMQLLVPRWEVWLLALGTALAYFACIVLHELGHATVGRAVGMPINGITLFLFGGVAELGEEPRSASSEFLMAIAGPLVTVVLAILFLLLTEFGKQAGWPLAALVVFHWLFLINAIVLIFNLIPAFPLDGGRVLRAILWGAFHSVRRATRVAAMIGQGFAWLLITLGVLSFFGGSVANGIWMVLIGWFLNNAARGSYEQVLIRQALAGERVRRFMNTNPVVVSPSVTLRQWVEDYVYRHHRKAFPVTHDGHLEGVITTQALASYPREEWDRHTVGEVMRRDFGPLSVHPDTDAMEALSKIQSTGSSRLLVTEGDRLVGIVALKDLLRFLDLKLQLDAGDDGFAPRPPSAGGSDGIRRPTELEHSEGIQRGSY